MENGATRNRDASGKMSAWSGSVEVALNTQSHLGSACTPPSNLQGFVLPGEKLFAFLDNIFIAAGTESTKGRRKSGAVQVRSPFVANTLSRQGEEPVHQCWSGGATSRCRRVSASWALHLDIRTTSPLSFANEEHPPC